MKLGLHIPNFTWPGGPGTLGQDLAGVARTAEDAGFDRISVMDHVWQIHLVGPPEHEMLEAYTTLGYLAAHTSRIKLLTLVTGVVYRDPGGYMVSSPRSSPPSTCSPEVGHVSASARRGTKRKPGASGCCSHQPRSASSAWRKPSRSACKCGATMSTRTRVSITSSSGR